MQQQTFITLTLTRETNFAQRSADLRIEMTALVFGGGDSDGDGDGDDDVSSLACLANVILYNLLAD